MDDISVGAVTTGHNLPGYDSIDRPVFCASSQARKCRYTVLHGEYISNSNNPHYFFQQFHPPHASDRRSEIIRLAVIEDKSAGRSAPKHR